VARRSPAAFGVTTVFLSVNGIVKLMDNPLIEGNCSAFYWPKNLIL
jgi:hypothetical protein